MSIVDAIRCSNCGAPIPFNPGEIVSTCRYCGFTQVIQTGKAFVFEHSIILNKYIPEQVDELVRNWMKSGFLKPSDLSKSSRILEKNLIYLPFWVISIEASTTYKGVFERLTPPVMKEGKIEKKYDWLILARKATDFPTREYKVPLEGKIPYDFRKVEAFAKVLNSEIEQNEAIELAKQEIDNLHIFLAKKDVDKMVEMKTDVNISNSVYLHAPIWFIAYEYKHERYHIFLDGATSSVVKGDIPSTKFGLI